MASSIVAVLAFTSSFILTAMARDCYGVNYFDDDCRYPDFNVVPIVVTVSFLFITFTLIVFCCVCPCCCLYKMCRKPRPVVATTTTTVVTQFPQQQQPPNPATQYAPYQPIPAQPGYPVQPGYGTPAPYQGQPYAPGPPPPYQESGGYPSPYSQAAYDGTQPPYPLNPLVQPGYSHPPPQPDYNAAQPAYNPAYVEPPKTGY